MQPRHLAIRPSESVTNRLYEPTGRVRLIETDRPSVVEFTNVVVSEMPEWLVATAPASKFVPATVAGTCVAPCTNEFGVIEAIVGGLGLGPMVRHAEHVKVVAGKPGSATVMLRAVCVALAFTFSVTFSWVEETTVEGPLWKTPSPDTITFGVPENPLPVSVSVSVVDSPIMFGTTLEIAGPGVVIW